MLIEMKVRGITFDLFYNAHIIILKDISDKYALPIWVGPFEATAIQIVLNQSKLPRPLPYDIMKELLNRLELKLEKIIVNDLRDNTFFALIELNKNAQKIQIDSRPSDAIALALRMDAPIMVSDMVIRKAKMIDISDETKENKHEASSTSVLDKEKLREWLEKLKPEDFGKYEM